MTSIIIAQSDGLSSSTAIKGPCRVATTANIALSGTQTIDGVAVVTDDRVLVKNQTTASENGIWVVDTGPWRRSKDFNKTRDVRKGTMVVVAGGTVGSGLWQITTADPIDVGTSNIAFLLLVPDVSTSVTLAGTQTLTNKTLTSPAINTPTITGGTIASATLTLKQSAAPTPTAEGDTQWDSDDNVLAIGDGAATQLFVPIPASTAAGDIEYFTGAKVKARLAKGTSSQALLMNAGATAPAWATLPFTASYDSGQQAITAAGSLTLAHGLSAKPKLITTALQCTTAEFDYSIGDEVAINVGSHDSPAGSNRGLSIVPDATNLTIRFGAAAAPLNVLHKTTGAISGITPASWKFVVRAQV